MATSAVSATSSTETQYPILINGYLCYSAAEVRAARQLINPRTIDKITGLPTRGDDEESSSSSSTTSASASASATSTRQSFIESLRTYTAQGSNSEDDQLRSRGSLVDLYA